MNMTVNFTKTLGPIRAMHAVGQPPMPGFSNEYFHYLTEANIPYSRLHDVGGAFGRNLFVDVPNLFRDFDADENDPASYDFTFTDRLIEWLYEAKCPPIFRLGVTIENHHRIRAYRILPPPDFAKWARICEHIIRHYNEGWADGYHFGIVYWEIWNEPENGMTNETNQMWHGTKEQYYELYSTAAIHLKKCFGDTIKVGGFAGCGYYGVLDPTENPWFGEPINKYRLLFTDEFLAHLKAKGAPLDFFSWHSYGSVENTVQMADYVEETLKKFGFEHTETQLNEWNNAANSKERGTSAACAKHAAMLLAMQYKKTDILCYYDARIGASVYGGLFNPITFEPFCAYYAFKAFGELYAMGTQTECVWEGSGIYAAAARGADGKRALMIANTGEDTVLTTNLDADMRARIIDEAHSLAQADLDPKSFCLPKNTVIIWSNR